MKRREALYDTGCLCASSAQTRPRRRRTFIFVGGIKALAGSHFSKEKHIKKEAELDGFLCLVILIYWEQPWNGITGFHHHASLASNRPLQRNLRLTRLQKLIIPSNWTWSNNDICAFLHRTVNMPTSALAVVRRSHPIETLPQAELCVQHLSCNSLQLTSSCSALQTRLLQAGRVVLCRLRSTYTCKKNTAAP